MARPKKQQPDPMEGKLKPPIEVIPKKVEEPSLDICLDTLLAGAMSLVSHELECIKQEAASGKLLPEVSRDLVSYTKLLYDIKNDTSDALESYTDEELMRLAGK